ncbi:response regulator [Geotalea toluenoxydans]|uniref:response regulator n=1 Tax=Geotalea toluenoxydans TaxID=421624 RepID=UPI0006D0A88A|nr:response regulator [Geotalea toluenoxydans]
MQGLLIADEDLDSRKSMADLFIEAGYNVMVTNSAANVLYGILKKTAQVVLLSSEFDELTATDLVPILKKCDQNLTIILVSNEVSLPLMRKLRKEGIFYHALKPVKPEDREEIRQAVECAFENLQGSKNHKPQS